MPGKLEFVGNPGARPVLGRDRREEHGEAAFRAAAVELPRDGPHPGDVALPDVEVLPVGIGDPRRVDLPDRHRHRLEALGVCVAIEGDLMEVVVLETRLELAESRKERRLGPDREAFQPFGDPLPVFLHWRFVVEGGPPHCIETEAGARILDRILDVARFPLELVGLNLESLDK